MRHVVENPSSLAEAMAVLLPDSSGRTRKQVLERGRVRVNGKVVKVGRTALAPGDRVEIGEAAPSAKLPPGLTLVYEDEHLLVVDKDAGVLSIATAKEREQTAYRWLSTHVKERDPRAKVFIVHRLDRDASGLLVFARTPEMKRALMTQLQAHTVDREYVAVVEGRVEKDDGTVESRLEESETTGKVHVEHRSDKGALARTHFRTIARGERHSTLGVRLETGRKHQIRVHLASIGHPIAGDETYGARTRLPRLALHAATLGFDHPTTGERLRFTSQVPGLFAKLRRRS